MVLVELGLCKGMPKTMDKFNREVDHPPNLDLMEYPSCSLGVIYMVIFQRIVVLKILILLQFSVAE